MPEALLVPDIVTRCKDLIRAGMEEALEALHPDVAQDCRYYLGWCDLDGTPHRQRGSRTVHAPVVLLSAQAVGADPHTAIPGAVAIELMLNATLLMDDIIDEDAVRRGRPTVWAARGAPESLLAAVGLWAEVNNLLLGLPGDGGTTAFRLVNDQLTYLFRVVAAERDLMRRHVTELSAAELDAHLELCYEHDGALLGCSAAIGVLLGGGSLTAAAPLVQAAEHAGAAWKIMNDVEDLWQNRDLVGKPGYKDLQQRRKTFPLLAAVRATSPAADRLHDLLGQDSLDAETFAVMAQLIEQAGGLESAETAAHSHLARARALLDEFPMPDPVKAELNSVFHHIAIRRPQSPAVDAGSGPRTGCTGRMTGSLPSRRPGEDHRNGRGG
ncbi:polyprenyl synthetase family protein [Streptomyces mashuensis]|uniref:polyprenyl synthetase family protein n=1 Tax=Streptomyces mashuensis TaxID=33904 RepID=UPI00167E0926|nr:polyprenyl synthetase family protein [Streptomyces mashuensis]